MSFFDIIRELRTGKPDIKKAVKTLAFTGWICIGVGIWNFVFSYLAPIDKSPFNLPKYFPLFALISMLLVGTLFLLSSRVIFRGIRVGIKLGQSAVILLIGIICGFAFMMFEMSDSFPQILPFRIFFAIIVCVVSGQFLIPAYLGIRYLERLPIKEIKLEEIRFGQDHQTQLNSYESSKEIMGDSRKYKEALLPFGVGGSFILLLACLLIPIFIIQKFYGIGMMPLVFIPGFILIFFGPIIYNSFPSSFQKGRNVIASYTGGGSIFMFNGSWPFFRLFVYADGIEIRVMLHRFFIPHDKMDDIPEKDGFFNKGILIKSELPGVPSSIRFMAMGSHNTVQTILHARNEFIRKMTPC